MTTALLVVGGLFVLIYGPLALLAWRRRLLARLALRESTRRRGQFVLLVGGLLIGSACITASLVAADSVTVTATNIYSQRLGAVDLTVTDAAGRPFPSDYAHRLASDEALTPFVAGVQAGVELTASVTDIDQRLGKPSVFLVGFDPSTQRRFGEYVLTDGRHTYGAGLGPRDVLLSSGLAASLEARTGDHLRIAIGAGSNDLDLQVYGVAVASGPGAYGSNFAVFVPLATAQRIVGDGGINVIRVATNGGTPADLDPDRRAVTPLRAAVARIHSDNPLVVNQVRVDTAGQVERASAYLLGTTLGFSLLSVLAAAALIVNLVVALAEERRPRLAVLRAIGVTRAGLITMSVLEGALYSLAAAVFGVAVGVLIGRFLATELWNALLIDPGSESIRGVGLQWSVKPVTLAVAFAAGALLTLGTVAATSYRTSRMTVAAAIRDLPEPASAGRGGSLRTLALGVVALLGAAMLAAGDPRVRLLGGVAVIVGVAGLARGRLPDRPRATLTGLLLAAWAAVMAAGNQYSSDLGRFFLVIFQAVIFSAIGLCVAAAANLRLVDGVLGLLGNGVGRLRATLLPPLAYLSRRPVRTGLATSAFALVMVLVTMVAVIVAAGSTTRYYERDSAGFDIAVVTSGPEPLQLPVEIGREVTAQTVIPMRRYQGPYNAPAFGPSGTSVFVVFYVLPDAPALDGPIYLRSRESRFATDADMWHAVRTQSGLVVGDWGSGVAAGDELTVLGVNGQLRIHVAGTAATTVLNGILASSATVASIETQPIGSTVLLKLKDGTDARALAHALERSMFAQGVQATPTREILDQDYQSGTAYVIEYDVLLHMGLLVGVLALAMILIRAAVDRRRAIGTLRALGYQPSRIVSGLMIESALGATIGAATGILSGLLIGNLLISHEVAGSSFGVDAGRLGVALAIVYGTVIITTGPLAWRVARMAPIEAIRMTG